jgi:RND family efflux transporter MFP subunit
LRVRFDAFKEIEIPAHVKEIGKEASQATRTYPVNLIMDQPEGVKILPGMAGIAHGAARLPETGGSGSVTVPVTAVFSSEAEEQSFVWVIDETTMTVARRPVKVDSLSDTGVSVTEGLQPGEWIATAGVHYLKEGQKVRILDTPEG